jgi:acyl-CoA thioesterase
VNFSELTAVRRTATDSFDVDVDPSSFIVRGPNGGYLAAVLLRAMTARVADLGDEPGRPPRSLTVHYARAPVEGPATVTTELVRVGRSLVTCAARLEQSGKPALVALGAFSPAWTGPSWRHDPPPDIPGPDTVDLPVRDRPPLPFTSHWDHRYAFGTPPGGKSDTAETGGWLRLAQPEPVDAIVITAMADAWFPAAHAMVDAPVPTIDLTVHFRVALPYAALGPEDFVLARFVSSTANEGFVEEDGQLWAPDGVLVAQSRQLAILLPG